MTRSERYVIAKEAYKRAQEAQKRRDERRMTRRESINQALRKTKKADLIEILLRLVDEQEEAALWLVEGLQIVKATQDEIHDIEQDIKKATDVPRHLINHNFPYDDAAYSRIEMGLRRLVAGGHLDVAMKLGQTLMRAGSHQVEMSDEGMMTDQIVQCLRVVVTAVRNAEIDDAKKTDWYILMKRTDGCGCLWAPSLHEH